MQAAQNPEATKTNILFLGLLANVDSTVLNVSLDHNFMIEAKPYEELIDLIARLENKSAQEVLEEIKNHWCINDDEKKIYTISNSLESDLENQEVEINVTSDSCWKQFESNLLQACLIPTLRSMRLFKEGNIHMPLSFYYTVLGDGEPKFLIKTAHNLPSEPEAYSLQKSEIQELKSFIQNTKLPFKEDFLNLALESFELSYSAHNISLSFLTSMIGLEALFNDGKDEISYKLSRCTAAILDEDFQT